eukprot:scaffold48021_cov22-Tisochrysis_lutea.AAC.1
MPWCHPSFAIFRCYPLLCPVITPRNALTAPKHDPWSTAKAHCTHRAQYNLWSTAQVGCARCAQIIVVAINTKTKADGMEYYEYELNQLDAFTGPHALAQVTSK